jgi:hypothetical protein
MTIQLIARRLCEINPYLRKLLFMCGFYSITCCQLRIIYLGVVSYCWFVVVSRGCVWLRKIYSLVLWCYSFLCNLLCCSWRVGFFFSSSVFPNNVIHHSTQFCALTYLRKRFVFVFTLCVLLDYLEREK